jgi:hypothetical protein
MWAFDLFTATPRFTSSIPRAPLLRVEDPTLDIWLCICLSRLLCSSRGYRSETVDTPEVFSHNFFDGTAGSRRGPVLAASFYTSWSYRTDSAALFVSLTSGA